MKITMIWKALEIGVEYNKILNVALSSSFELIKKLKGYFDFIIYI